MSESTHVPLQNQKKEQSNQHNSPTTSEAESKLFTNSNIQLSSNGDPALGINNPGSFQQMMNNTPEAKKGASIQAMINNSSTIVAQRKVQDYINNSHIVKKGLAIQAMIDHSPRMVEEREKLTTLFNGKNVVHPITTQNPNCNTTDTAQRKLNEEKEPLQIKSSTGSSTKMPESIQGKMEQSFNADFSDVNIHTNSDQATDLTAHAFTQGQDIHFAPGQYNPESKNGQELLGHELTHVVQQKQGRVQPTTQLKGVGINDNEGLEKEADEMGKLAAEGASAKSNSSTPPPDGKPFSSSLIQKKDDDDEKNKKVEIPKDAVDAVSDTKDDYLKNTYSFYYENKLKLKKEVKSTLKVAFHRGTPVFKSAVKDNEGDVEEGEKIKLEGPSQEISRSFDGKTIKFSEKLLSGSFDLAQALTDWDGGFKAELKGDIGKIDLKNGVPDIKVGALEFAVSGELNKDTLYASEIGKAIAAASPVVVGLIEQGWKIKLEAKIELYVLTPEDIAKRLKINKLLEEQRKLADEVVELEKQTKDLKRQYKSKEQEFLKKSKENFEKSKPRGSNKKWSKKDALKKFKKSDAAKALKRQIGDSTAKASKIAKRVETIVKEVDGVAKSFTTKFGKMVGQNSMKAARFFATKILSRLLIVLAIIDTVVLIAKLIKYIDHLKFGFDQEGVSIDDAPLFGDVPEESEESEFETEGTDMENGSFETGDSECTSDGENETKSDGDSDVEYFPEDFDVQTPDQEIKSNDDTISEGTTSNPETTSNSETTTPVTSSGKLSPEALAKLDAAPENVKQLWNLITENSADGNIEDKDLEEFLKIVPPDLEEGEVYFYASLVDAGVKVEPELALKKLDNLIKDYRQDPEKYKEEIKDKENSSNSTVISSTDGEENKQGNSEIEGNENNTNHPNYEIAYSSTEKVTEVPSSATDEVETYYEFSNTIIKIGDVRQIKIHAQTMYGPASSELINFTIKSIDIENKLITIYYKDIIEIKSYDENNNVIYHVYIDATKNKIISYDQSNIK